MPQHSTMFSISAVENPTRRIDYIFTNKQSKNSPFKVTPTAACVLRSSLQETL
jgi:endonuclease/exonuclease/phosphatase family metal-dependent hydrolase